MSKKFPLVYYKEDGERVVVGEAEIDGDKITALVTDTEALTELMPIDYSHFSVGEDGDVEMGLMGDRRKAERRNVFQGPSEFKEKEQ